MGQDEAKKPWTSRWLDKWGPLPADYTTTPECHCGHGWTEHQHGFSLGTPKTYCMAACRCKVYCPYTYTAEPRTMAETGQEWVQAEIPGVCWDLVGRTRAPLPTLDRR